MNTQVRIALVEDDQDLRESTEEYLAHAGYGVWGVASAEAFFRRFVADPVDVVVLDIGLPGEDGLSVAELLKKNPSVAVVILSARDALEYRLLGLRAGADRYLVKPINLAELVANIEAVVTGRALAMLPASAPTPPSVPASGVQPVHSEFWSLRERDWTLTAPSGRAVAVTAREYALLYQLIVMRGQPVSKSTLTDALFGQRAINADERLNVMLARLRKKAQLALAEPLPLKTAHNVGYAFTVQAILL
jgi:DNA-binding response OmpR family regulator